MRRTSNLLWARRLLPALAILALAVLLAGCGAPEPTATAVPPTAVAAANTDTPAPADTAVPPTDTAVPPTDTAEPPTETPVPPTATAVPATDTPEPTPTLDAMAALMADTDDSACVECHTDEEQLRALAVEPEEVEALSEGEG